jgi:hypothetical protein
VWRRARCANRLALAKGRDNVDGNLQHHTRPRQAKKQEDHGAHALRGGDQGRLLFLHFRAHHSSFTPTMDPERLGRDLCRVFETAYGGRHLHWCSHAEVRALPPKLTITQLDLAIAAATECNDVSAIPATSNIDGILPPRRWAATALANTQAPNDLTLQAAALQPGTGS